MSLQEADMGLTNMAMDGGNSARYAADDSLLVKFYYDRKENQAKSLEMGRPIFEEVPYVHIMQPGNKDSIVCRPATEMDKQRFPEHFRKFEARESQEAVEGTPLSQWPGVTRSQVEEMRYFNITTVEQLSAVTDSNAQNMMGFSQLREKAKRYLEAAKDQATAERLEASEKEVKELREMVASLLEAQDAAKQPKRRGRPPKED